MLRSTGFLPGALLTLCLLGTGASGCSPAEAKNGIDADDPDDPTNSDVPEGDDDDGASTGSGGCCDLQPVTFQKLAEGHLTFASPTSAPISVAGYAQVVLYLNNDVMTVCKRVEALFRPDASTAFLGTGQLTNSDSMHATGARLRVDGRDMMLKLSVASTCSSVDYHYVVAGVSGG